MKTEIDPRVPALSQQPEEFTVGKCLVRKYLPAIDGNQTRAVVFVHGMWSDGPSVFERLASFMSSQGFTSYVITLPHHFGRIDEQALGRTSILRYAKSVEAVIRFRIGECTLIGHSMGGLISQKVASESSLIKELVLIASAAPKGILALNWKLLRAIIFRGYLKMMLAKKAFFLGSREVALFLTNRMSFSQQQTLRLQPESGLAARECALGRVKVDERRVHCPVLVLAGDDDNIFSPKIQRRIARKYAGQFEIIRKAGHMLLCEDQNWRECAGKILQWITAAPSFARS